MPYLKRLEEELLNYTISRDEQEAVTRRRIEDALEELDSFSIIVITLSHVGKNHSWGEIARLTDLPVPYVRRTHNRAMIKLKEGVTRAASEAPTNPN